MRISLDILITRYTESVNLLLRLLDSIKNQLEVNFDLINVLVITDGLENELSELPSSDTYPFKLSYLTIDKAGVCAARQAGFNASNGDYVIFCDTDDFFHSNLALCLIFNLIANFKMDLLRSIILHLDKETSCIAYTEAPATIHGKVFSRAFLKNHNIEWDRELVLYEDGNFMTKFLSWEPAVCDISGAFYCYHVRPGSVTALTRENRSIEEAFSIHCNGIIKFAYKTLSYLQQNNNITYFNSTLQDSIYILYTYWSQLKLLNIGEQLTNKIIEDLQKLISDFNIDSSFSQYLIDIFPERLQMLLEPTDKLLKYIPQDDTAINFYLSNFVTWCLTLFKLQ